MKPDEEQVWKQEQSRLRPGSQETCPAPHKTQKPQQQTGLINNTRKVRWMHIEAGSMRWAAEGLMIVSISKGPIYFGASFLEVGLSGMSLVANQTR